MKDREEIEFIPTPSGEVYGYLFFSADEKKLIFTGDMDESAKIFFEQCVQPMIDKYLKSMEEK